MSKTTKGCQLEFHARTGSAFVPYLKKQVQQILQVTRSPLRHLSVVLVGDRRISQLHEQFFKDPSTTDVITFPLELDKLGRTIAGELYVCVPMARREARRRKVRERDELLLYTLHGILHLHGYDDMTEDGYQEMHRKEDQILTRIGVGAVFKSAMPAGKKGGR